MKKTPMTAMLFDFDGTLFDNFCEIYAAVCAKAVT